MRNKYKSAVSAMEHSRTAIAQQYHSTPIDPTMKQIILLLDNSQHSTATIAIRCGVSVQCINGWKRGKTKRPLGLTMKFVLRALGYDLRIVPSAGHNQARDSNDAA